MQPQLAQQKTVKRCALKLLLGAAAAVVILALVAYRRRVRLHHNLQRFLASLLNQVHVHHDAQDVTHLVRNLLEEPGGIFDSHDLALVIASNNQHTALGIGKATDPLQVLVPPGFLPFDVLGFFHTRRILPVNSSCIMPCLSWRALASFSSSAATSASMSVRIVAMAVCSALVEGRIIFTPISI